MNLYELNPFQALYVTDDPDPSVYVDRLASYRAFHQYNPGLSDDIRSTKTAIGEPIAVTADCLKAAGVIQQDTPVFVRIDQIERLYRSDVLRPELGKQYRRMINKVIGSRDSRISYRVGTRPYAWDDDLTIHGTDDKLEDLRDYRRVDLDEMLRRKEDRRTWIFPEFARDAFNRRLRRAYSGFDPSSVDDTRQSAAGTRSRQWHRPTRVNGELTMPGKLWSREETLAAFNLYCRTPFGRLHARNPEVITLAGILGRTANALAMKCCNLAAFDPALQTRGIKGLSKTSALDREIWDSFEKDPERTGFQSEAVCAKLMDRPLQQAESVEWADVKGLDKEAITKVRVNQHLFRSIILTSYREECAVCGLPVLGLLVACHIVPWALDPHNRMNPRNGLCMCSLHDRAYETGILLIDERLVVGVGGKAECYRGNDAFKRYISAFEGAALRLPERWHPDPAFLQKRRALVSASVSA